MAGVLKKREGTETPREGPCEHRGRDQGLVASSQRVAGATSSRGHQQPELPAADRGEAGFSPGASVGAQSCPHLDSGLLASTSMTNESVT